MLKFTVDEEPQGKGRHRSGGGRQYTPAKTVTYEKRIRAACLDAMRRQGVARLEGPLRLSLVARFAPPASVSKKKRAAMLAGEVGHTKRVDLDNHLKAVLDAIQDGNYGPGLFADDCQVVELVARKVYAASAGSDITVEEVLQNADRGGVVE